MRTLTLVATASSLLLSQVLEPSVQRPVAQRSAADGGSLGVDAGAQSRVDGGSTSGSEASLASMAVELSRSRSEIAELKIQVQQLKAAQAARDRELQELKEQVRAESQRRAQADERAAQLAQDEAKSQAEERDRIARSRQAAVDLAALDGQLAGGNANVESALRTAETALGPSARAYLQAARRALANNDLANARVYLYLATLDAQRGF